MSHQENPSAASAAEMNTFFEQLAGGPGRTPEVTIAEWDRAVVRLAVKERHLRPGGFISGPTQMGLADHAAYVAVFTRVGITPMALTSNLNINFLRPCQGTWLEAEARTLKFGKTGVVIDVHLRGEASDKLSSQASVTYVLPPDAR